MSKTYFYESSFFPVYFIDELLNKRDDWKITDKTENTDFCWLSGFPKVCEGLVECYNKYIYKNCSNSIVRGDIPIYVKDYVFGNSLIQLADKALLYKKIREKFGDRNYLIDTIDISVNNIYKYKKYIENSNKNFYLKPNEGGLREGQIKTDNYEEIVNNLKNFKKFKNWQLQEFVESYTKTPSYIRAISVLVIENNKINLYVSNFITYAGIYEKKTGYVKITYGGENSSQYNNCYIYKEDFNKNDYIGKPGFADDIYDKLLGKGQFEKQILPKIYNILKESIKSINIPELNKKNIYFHTLASDLMIDKNLDVKFLETNLQPADFMTGYLQCNDPKILKKAFGGKYIYDRKYKYEKELVDEIFSLTIDKIYKTKYKVKRKYLVKVI